MYNWFDSLSPQLLRARFEAIDQTLWEAEPLDARFFSDMQPVNAAVLVPIIQREQGMTVLLTMRTAHLSTHAGQISFPGGRCEPGDGTPIETALRETEEETGLQRKYIEVLGCMPVYQTATTFLIAPVVALVQSDFALDPDTFEVEEVFEVPLSFLMNPDNHQQRSLQTPMGPKQFYAMPYQPVDSDKSWFIWGATASILRNLHHFLKVGV